MICPTCHIDQDMDAPALSRYADIEICSDCGTREAMSGHFWWKDVCENKNIELAIKCLMSGIMRKFSHSDTTYEAEKGPKYARIVETFHFPNNDSRSVYCFVDMRTGDMYYPKSWKGPRTKNSKGQPDIRGNVFSGDYGLSWCERYGLRTLR